MIINKKKGVFNSEKILYLGYQILKDGILPDPSLIRKILEVSPPTNRKELESELELEFDFN